MIWSLVFVKIEPEIDFLDILLDEVRDNKQAEFAEEVALQNDDQVKTQENFAEEVTKVSKTQKVAYIRVSTAEQNPGRQLEALKGEGVDKVFEDKASGKDANRPGLQAMLEYIREGDTVIVSEFSRLGRSTADLLDIVARIEAQGASLVSLKESFDTSTPAGRFQMTMLAAISQFERELMLERQREGIALAKEAGKYKGRKRVYISDIEKHYQRYMRREISKPKLAKELGISRSTLDRLFAECCKGAQNGKE